LLRYKRHFTFIELILASVIFLIAVLGTSSFYFVNRRNLTRARLRREATWKAIDAMESLESKLKDAISDENGNYEDGDEVLYEEDTVALGNQTATLIKSAIFREIEEDGTVVATFFQATVTVTWNDSDVEFVSYIAEP